MKKILLLLISITLSACSSNNHEESKKNPNTAGQHDIKETSTAKKEPSPSLPPDKNSVPAVQEKTGQIEEFNAHIKSMEGGAFIKEHRIENNHNAVILFVKDYEEFKQKNPSSSITEEKYDSFWSKESAVQKLLIDQSSRMIKRFSFLNTVYMEAPVKGVVYSVQLSRERAEKIPDDLSFAERNKLAEELITIQK
ncbi:hypothetical protein [Peribacillus kribbensis]|uniref:hypothetical protein n=1 Tax=Peribacillus kribbensis TaxID=356658 RepID=UPI0003F5521E|nr:hypothetical protein [Peribacillus kribbensis]